MKRHRMESKSTNTQQITARDRRARTRALKRGDDAEPSNALIICVWQHKGGVGKSQVALELAHAMTGRGQRVGLMDLDAQATLSQMLANANMDQVIDYRYRRGRLPGLQALNIPTVDTDGPPDVDNDPLRPDTLQYDPQQPIQTDDGDSVLVPQRTRGLNIGNTWNIVRTAQGVTQMAALTMEDKSVATLFAKGCLSVMSDEDMQARWGEMNAFPQEWQGVPVNPEDYPDGQLVLFPGDTESTIQLAKMFEAKDATSDVSMKRMMVRNCARFESELCRQNQLDVLIVDLDPSVSAINKWHVAHIADMVVAPVQPNISSAFAVKAALADVWPGWVQESQDLGVATRFNLHNGAGIEGPNGRGTGAVGQRGRSGTFRILPHVMTNYNRTGGAIHVVDYNMCALIDMVARNSSVPDGARANMTEVAERVDKAALMHQLYLPEGTGEIVLPMWPRMDSLTNANEMGMPLGAVTKEN